MASPWAAGPRPRRPAGMIGRQAFLFRVEGTKKTCRLAATCAEVGVEGADAATFAEVGVEDADAATCVEVGVEAGLT